MTASAKASGGDAEMKMRRWFVATLGIGCLIGVAWLGSALFAGSKAMAEGTTPQGWEYMVASVSKYDIWFETLSGESLVKAAGMGFASEAYKLQNELDAAGASGWELVTVVGIIGGDQEFIFKRLLP
jgi:hypothetical protein